MNTKPSPASKLEALESLLCSLRSIASEFEDMRDSLMSSARSVSNRFMSDAQIDRETWKQLSYRAERTIELSAINAKLSAERAEMDELFYAADVANGWV